MGVKRTAETSAILLILVVVIILMIIMLVTWLATTPEIPSNGTVYWIRCLTDNDCPANQKFCNTGNQQCVECMRDSQCPRDYHCADYKCVEDVGAPCYSNDDCIGNDLCENGACCEPVTQVSNITMATIGYVLQPNPVPGGLTNVLRGAQVKVEWSGVPNATNYTLQVSDTNNFAMVRHQTMTSNTTVNIHVPMGSIMYYRILSHGCGPVATSQISSFYPALPNDLLHVYVSYYVASVESTGELYYMGPANDVGVESTAYCLSQYPSVGCSWYNHSGNQLVPLADQSQALTGATYMTSEVRVVPVDVDQQILYVQPPQSWYMGDYGGVLALRSSVLSGDPSYYYYNGNLWSSLSSDVNVWVSDPERTTIWIGME